MRELCEAGEKGEGGVSSIDLRCADIGAVIKTVAPESVALVVADPPWDYQNWTDAKQGAAAHYYDGLSMYHIAAHLAHTYDLAMPNAYMAVWCTFPKLAEWISHFNVFQRGGWEYITGAVWGKTNGLGIGFHVRGDAELVLLYKKGAPKPQATTSNLWLAPRIGHSEKPQKALRALLELATQPGDLVLDVYAGASASMARACRALGRDYVGAEIDPARHNEAMLRLSQQEMFGLHQEQALTPQAVGS